MPINNGLDHIVVAAAYEAGTYLCENAFDRSTMEFKKGEDPVTSHDREAERLLISVFERYAPGNYIGEELGHMDNGLPRTYIMDPIDGTKSFLLHEFYTSLSIGVEEDGKLVMGAVYDFMKDIMYVGYRGNAYMLHGDKRHEMGPHPFSRIRLSIDDYGLVKQNRNDYSLFDKRGSIALCMAELAAGHFDGMINSHIGKGNVWDVAGGYYLLKCQGFDVYDIHGRPFDYHNGQNGMIAIAPQHKEKVLADLRLEVS